MSISLMFRFLSSTGYKNGDLSVALSLTTTLTNPAHKITEKKTISTELGITNYINAIRF